MEDLEEEQSRIKKHFYDNLCSTASCQESVLAAWRGSFPSSSGAAKRAGELRVEERALLEDALRSLLADIVENASHARQPVMGYCGDAPHALMPRFLDMALYLLDHDYLDSGAVMSLLEDLVDTTSTLECERVFEHLYNNADLLRRKMIQGSKLKNPSIAVLRLCNAMLKRQAKSYDAQLCGHVLQFLADLLPLMDRSGLNVPGNINDAHSTLIEDVQPGAVDSNGEPIRVDFYKTFWSLESVFQKPNQLLGAPAKWNQTTGNIRMVLNEFEAQPVTVSSSAAVAAATQAGADNVTVKHLSSASLMSLQLQDAMFRRNFLLQCLILLHFAEDSNVKDPAKELKPKQLEELKELRAQVCAVLRATPDEGEEFEAAMQQVLMRETCWARWKKSGCADYMKPAAPCKGQPWRSTLPKRSSSSRVDVGNATLSELWSICEHNGDGLTVADRSDVLPSIEKQLQRVADQMDPACMEDEEFKVKNDSLFQWKTLRMLADTRLQSFLSIMDEKVGSDADRLELAVSKLMPEKVPQGWKRPVVEAAKPPPAAPANSGGSEGKARQRIAFPKPASSIETGNTDKPSESVSKPKTPDANTSSRPAAVKQESSAETATRPDKESSQPKMRAPVDHQSSGAKAEKTADSSAADRQHTAGESGTDKTKPAMPDRKASGGVSSPQPSRTGSGGGGKPAAKPHDKPHDKSPQSSSHSKAGDVKKLAASRPEGSSPAKRHTDAAASQPVKRPRKS